jgi:hypothetical protein
MLFEMTVLLSSKNIISNPVLVGTCNCKHYLRFLLLSVNRLKELVYTILYSERQQKMTLLSLCFIQDVKVLLRTHIKCNTSINPSSTSDSTLHRKLAERRSIIHLLLLLLLICVSICTSIFGDFTDVNYLMTSMPGDADLKQCNRSRYLFSLAKVACDR